MRTVLADLLLDAARDERFLVLSADHGHRLFDPFRERHPDRFLNVGIAEQAMVGVAAGLARTGFRPCVYGLASFVPMRVLEQIKLDVCFAGEPVLFIGDGAGLVHSTLGASHQCGEDVACLRALPGISIYSPCDGQELRACWREARAADRPAYLRIGKSDRPAMHDVEPDGTDPTAVVRPAPGGPPAAIVATGSMVAIGARFAREAGIACVSVPRITPAPESLPALLGGARRVAVLEEHVSAGGLWSVVLELLQTGGRASLGIAVEPMGLERAFTRFAGGHQQALSEHRLDDATLWRRLQDWLGAPSAGARLR